MGNQLVEAMGQIEAECNAIGLEHRFVGGCAYVAWMTEATEAGVDIGKRRVTLEKYVWPSAVREDGSVRDIDLLVIAPDSSKLLTLKKWLEEQAKTTNNPVYKYVTVETVVTTQERKGVFLPQFVTTIELTEGKYYLVFDGVRQEIPSKSLEAWTLVVGEAEFTVRNPIANLLAYYFRVPSGIKPKDQVKMGPMEKLAELTKSEANKVDLDYESGEWYGNWVKYIQKLSSAGGLVRLKAGLTRWYWQTIGNQVSHAKGPWGENLVKWSNKFTGSYQ